MPIIGYSANDSDDWIWKEALRVLSEAYPGHSWYVEVKEGSIIVKDLKISDVWAYHIKKSAVMHDAARRKRALVMGGGEFLEAANMRRGAWQGEYATDLEGRPKGQKFRGMIAPPQQPNSLKIVNQHGKEIAVVGEQVPNDARAVH